MGDINWDFEWSPDSKSATVTLYNVDIEVLKKIMKIVDPNYTFDD